MQTHSFALVSLAIQRVTVTVAEKGEARTVRFAGRHVTALNTSIEKPNTILSIKRQGALKRVGYRCVGWNEMLQRDWSKPGRTYCLIENQVEQV